MDRIKGSHVEVCQAECGWSLVEMDEVEWSVLNVEEWS